MKQAVSSGLAHCLNLLVAVIFDRLEDYNACVWYFLNIMIDTTFGCLIAILLLKLLEYAVNRFHWTSLRTGSYKTSTKAISMKPWILQLTAWVCIFTIMKAIVVGIMWLLHSPLNSLGEAIFAPIEPYPKVELVVVMVVVPLIMNSFQYWVTDSFLKKKNENEPLSESLLRKEIEMEPNAIN